MSRSSRAGFSLLETLVALTIVSMVAIGALGAVSAQTRADARALDALQGEALAEQKFAALAMVTAEELQFLPDTLQEGTFDAPLDAYHWTTDASTVVDEEGLYDVTLTVTWPTGKHVLRTFMYRRPTTTAGGG